MFIPNDLLYTKEHEWVRIDGQTGTVGITDYAQHSLGDVTFVDLPKTGSDVVQFKTLAGVERVLIRMRLQGGKGGQAEPEMLGQSI